MDTNIVLNINCIVNKKYNILALIHINFTYALFTILGITIIKQIFIN